MKQKITFLLKQQSSPFKNNCTKNFVKLLFLIVLPFIIPPQSILAAVPIVNCMSTFSSVNKIGAATGFSLIIAGFYKAQTGIMNLRRIRLHNLENNPLDAQNLINNYDQVITGTTMSAFGMVLFFASSFCQPKSPF